MPQLCNVRRLMNPDAPLDAAAAPGDPCDTGQWDFQLECQSGHLMTVGMV